MISLDKMFFVIFLHRYILIILDRVGEYRVSLEWLEQDKKLVRDHSNWSLEEHGRELLLEVQF